MAKWAKLHAKTSESYDFAEACNKDRLAGLLFLLALPHADVYGVLIGHPSIIRGKVCGLLEATNGELEKALDVLCETGLLMRYEDSKGRPLLWFPTYCKHQDVKWERAGRPDHELPQTWQPPEALFKAIQRKPDCVLAGWLMDWCRSNPGLVPDWYRLEVDVEVEVDTEPEPEDSTDQSVLNAHYWLARLFDIADGFDLPEPWPTLLTGWRRQYCPDNPDDLAEAAEATFGHFTGKGRVDRQRPERYMRSILERKAKEREQADTGEPLPDELDTGADPDQLDAQLRAEDEAGRGLYEQIEKPERTPEQIAAAEARVAAVWEKIQHGKSESREQEAH